MLAGLDEPVTRYLAHAIAEGTPLAPGVRLRMTGRIRVRSWLPFTADQESEAAGRAALEAVFAPVGLLPQRGVAWRAEGDDAIVARWEVPPEPRGAHRDRRAGRGAQRQRSPVG